MEQNIAIDIRNVSKCYRRYAHPVDRLKELILPHKPRGEEFWALRDISLQIERGESLGILGQNGSGKSTLLQIITNTLTPTTGTVHVSGRISALLELGSGFNPDFTGRQNVMVNGRILGFSQKEVEAKLDEIIDFAEIGDFVDQPVHTYSSGMFVRLAFAAAVVWDPEILIVDEALAVGDIFFQQKCFGRIKALQNRGTTLLFVSHDTQTILNLCRRAAVLEHGKLVYVGDSSIAVDRYFELYYMTHKSEVDSWPRNPIPNSEISSFNKSTEKSFDESTEIQVKPEDALPLITHFPEKKRYGQFVGLIQGVCITDKHWRAKNTMLNDEELVLSVHIGSFPKSIAPLNIGFHFKDRLGQLIIATNTKMLGQDLVQQSSGEPFVCQFSFRPQVAPGEYTIDVAVAENVLNAKAIYDWINNALSISLTSDLEKNKHAGVYWPEVDSFILNLEDSKINYSQYQ